MGLLCRCEECHRNANGDVIKPIDLLVREAPQHRYEPSGEALLARRR